MKRILFVVPLCVLLANCSSSRKAVAPAAPGISNVNVSSNGSASTAVNSTTASTSANRDWSYKAKYDTTLNGNWALQGMLGAAGWASTMQDTSTSSMASANTISSQGGGTTGTMGAAGTMSNDNSISTSIQSLTTTSSATTGAKTKIKTKNNRAIYDSAQARLSLNVQSPPSVIDSSLLQPYKYWGHTPSLVINAINHIFWGTTGCNSMSGSFNFSGNDIQFNKNIHTSKMNCNDYDEAGFLNALKKVDNYVVNGNQLELRQGNTLLLSFAKK